MKSVVRTRVGYSGGTTENPEYYNLGDHTETIQIDYDPALVSYSDLLRVFWKGHDPTRKAWSRQYMPAIFYHDEEQKRIATESRDREQKSLRSPILTQILPATEFFLAEDYHQKYALRNTRFLMEEFRRIYLDDADFVNSTAAARVNGYLYGYGSFEDLDASLNGLDAPPEKVKALYDYIKKRHQHRNGMRTN